VLGWRGNNQTSCTSVVTGDSPSIGSNPFNARVPNRRTGIQRLGPAFRFLWGKPVGEVGGTPGFVPPAVVGRLLSRMSQIPKIYMLISLRLSLVIMATGSDRRPDYYDRTRRRSPINFLSITTVCRWDAAWNLQLFHGLFRGSSYGRHSSSKRLDPKSTPNSK
jgi:hypothetical protein